MNVLKMLKGSATGNQTLYQIINGLGLTANLKLCLDAGDSASYNSSVQTAKWLDTSGGGYDFFRGTSTSGDAAEPTFNGTAGGLSSSEYFSFDGADYCLYDTTTETWMNNLHKDGVLCTFFVVYYSIASGVAERIFATRPTGAAGTTFIKDASNKAQINSFNTTTSVLSVSSTNTISSNAWNIMSISLNEPNATNNIFMKINSNSVETLSGAYSSPTATNVTGTPAIGSLANGTSPIASGARIACLAVWEGTALTSANLDSLHNSIKGRFGL